MLLAAWLAGITAFDLASVKAEPNLEKRAEKAMGNAYAACDRARESYQAGDDARFRVSLEEVRESVNLALESLEQTGKDPRKKPKHFKRMEQSTRGLLKKLSGLGDSVSVNHRDSVEEVKARVQQVQDDLIQGILTKSK
jgi:hypothetical protein